MTVLLLVEVLGISATNADKNIFKCELLL